MTDGVNEHGVQGSMNVVPNEKGDNTTIAPTQASEDKVCILMLIRYILDRYDNVATALDYIQKHVTLYHDSGILSLGYNLHFIFTDKTKDVYIVEFVDGEMRIHKNKKNYITNFHISDVNFNSNGSVYTPADVEDGNLPTEKNDITEHGQGLERFNLINKKYEKSSLFNLLKELKYTRCYKSQKNPSNPY